MKRSRAAAASTAQGAEVREDGSQLVVVFEEIAKVFPGHQLAVDRRPARPLTGPHEVDELLLGPCEPDAREPWTTERVVTTMQIRAVAEQTRVRRQGLQTKRKEKARPSMSRRRFIIPT